MPNSNFMAKSNWTFPFGVDPAWKLSENELQFYNSLKMKASIVIAYFHSEREDDDTHWFLC